MLEILEPAAQPAFLYESNPVHGSDPSRFSPAASLPGYYPLTFSNQKPQSDSRAMSLTFSSGFPFGRVLNLLSGPRE